MPFIDSKITVPVTSELKEEIKSELGQLITTLGKTETYLMVGIDDAYDLWLGGKKLDKGAYVSVSLYGNAPAVIPNDGNRALILRTYKLWNVYMI